MKENTRCRPCLMYIWMSLNAKQTMCKSYANKTISISKYKETSTHVNKWISLPAVLYQFFVCFSFSCLSYECTSGMHSILNKQIHLSRHMKNLFYYLQDFPFLWFLSSRVCIKCKVSLKKKPKHHVCLGFCEKSISHWPMIFPFLNGWWRVRYLQRQAWIIGYFVNFLFVQMWCRVFNGNSSILDNGKL